MEDEVKKFIGSIKVYCKSPTSPEFKNLERNLKRAAEQFDENDESSKSEILKALTSYEDYLRKNFKDRFQSATTTVPYETSRKYITEKTSSSPEHATKERGGSSSSKHSNSEQGTRIKQRPSSATKGNATNRVTKDDQKDRKTTPTPVPEEKRKAVLNKVNQKDGKATPTPKRSANKDATKVEDKNPSRDSTSLESNNWKTKFEEKAEEMNCLNEQVKLLAQELGLEGEASEKILTEAARLLKSIKEQKNKKQTESLKELESSLESIERVKKAVFEVPKVKEKDYDLEKTITRIQDLHKELKSIKEQKNKEQMERLMELESSLESVKKAVFGVKEKDHDLEKTITRIQDLHKSEQACLELKDIIFDEQLERIVFKIKLDEDQHSTENARKIFENLKKVWKNIDEERNVILETILGKETVQPVLNDVLQRLQVLKRDQNDLQDLLKAVSDTDNLVNTKQAIEKVQDLKRTEKTQHETIQKQSENLRRLETEISSKKDEISQMEKRYDSMKRNRDDIEQRLNNEVKRMQAEKNNALTRLSEVAGAKLTNENPHITDLSDPNRPIKIAEQYSELYDNAWTDIFEKLTEKCKVSEKEAIQMLLYILEISYQFCAEIASKRYRNMLAELTLLRLAVPDESKPKKKGGSKDETTKGKKQEIAQTPSSEEITVMQKFFDDPKQAVDIKTLKSVLEKIGVSETDMKNIKNLLKITVDGTCHFVEQHVWGKRSEIPAQDDVHLEIAKPYLKKCVRICWLMVAQDPPVFLKTSDKKDSNFDKDLYREFTSCGKKMDYVVWPAIFLHEGGPLLKKGVAQPKS